MLRAGTNEQEAKMGAARTLFLGLVEHVKRKLVRCVEQVAAPAHLVDQVKRRGLRLRRQRDVGLVGEEDAQHHGGTGLHHRGSALARHNGQGTQGS